MMADSLSESLIPVVKEQDVFIPASDDADLIAEFGRGNLYGMVTFAELFLGDVRVNLQVFGMYHSPIPCIGFLVFHEAKIEPLTGSLENIQILNLKFNFSDV